jgi:hypothetical protein
MSTLLVEYVDVDHHYVDEVGIHLTFPFDRAQLNSVIRKLLVKSIRSTHPVVLDSKDSRSSQIQLLELLPSVLGVALHHVRISRKGWQDMNRLFVHPSRVVQRCGVQSSLHCFHSPSWLLVRPSLFELMFLWSTANICLRCANTMYTQGTHFGSKRDTILVYQLSVYNTWVLLCIISVCVSFTHCHMVALMSGGRCSSLPRYK